MLNNPGAERLGMGGKFAINRGLLTELDNEELAVLASGGGARRSPWRQGNGAGGLPGGIARCDDGSATDYAGTAVGERNSLRVCSTRNTITPNARPTGPLSAAAGYDPEAAAFTLQEKSWRCLPGQGEASWLDGLFASHPPSTERVANNRSLVRQMRAEGFDGGELGTERYRAALARLEADADAYEAYDKAREALRDKRLMTRNRWCSRRLHSSRARRRFAECGELRVAAERYAEGLNHRPGDRV